MQHGLQRKLHQQFFVAQDVDWIWLAQGRVQWLGVWGQWSFIAQKASLYFSHENLKLHISKSMGNHLWSYSAVTQKTEVIMKSTIIWYVKMCCLIEGCSSKMAVTSYPTWNHFLEDTTVRTSAQTFSVFTAPESLRSYLCHKGISGSIKDGQFLTRWAVRFWRRNLLHEPMFGATDVHQHSFIIFR
jgi:hypothetical protein